MDFLHFSSHGLKHIHMHQAHRAVLEHALALTRLIRLGQLNYDFARLDCQLALLHPRVSHLGLAHFGSLLAAGIRCLASCQL